MLEFDSILNEVIFRLIVNLLVIGLLVRVIYYPVSKSRVYSFTFLLVNVLVFFICYLMNTVELSLGFGFGLFALFAILRYRTTTIPIKEMTYLFAGIVLALINGIAPVDRVFAVMNIAIVAFVWLMELAWFSNREQTMDIKYERVELLRSSEKETLEDIKLRTGLTVLRYEVKDFNFLNDTATLRIFYIK